MSKKDYNEIRKQSRLLLTLMTGLKEFQWFDVSNDKCILTPKMLPIWTSNIQCLEKLVELTEEPEKYE